MNSADLTPPSIEPVSPDVARPLWSVMIPTFNCARYLRRTLESVLASDPGEGRMQIEVIDDASGRDDPEAVTLELGRGRVGFHRKPRNEGAISNFNTCVQRSRGHLVHLLHGDDWVAPDFYRRVEKSAETLPDVAGFFARCFTVDEGGELEAVSDRIPALERPCRSPGDLLYANPIRTPGAVVRRSFYEAQGGFLPGLIHTADWEMWLRCIERGGALSINEPLAYYRMFPGNDTGRLAQTGENLRDALRLASLLAVRVPDFDEHRFVRAIAELARAQQWRFEADGNAVAGRANQAIWEELAPRVPWSQRIRLLLRAVRTAIRGR